MRLLYVVNSKMAFQGALLEMKDTLMIALNNVNGKDPDELAKYLLPKYALVLGDGGGTCVYFEAKDGKEWLDRHFSFVKRCSHSNRKACNPYDFCDMYFAQYEHDTFTFEKDQFLDFFLGILKVFSSDNAMYVPEFYRHNFMHRFQ